MLHAGSFQRESARVRTDLRLLHFGMWVLLDLKWTCLIINYSYFLRCFDDDWWVGSYFVSGIESCVDGFHVWFVFIGPKVHCYK